MKRFTFVTVFVTQALAACASTCPAPQPTVAPVEVRIPVAVSCVPDNLPAAPAYADSDAALRAAPDAAGRYALVAAGRTQREARLGEVEPVIAVCRQAGPR